MRPSPSSFAALTAAVKQALKDAELADLRSASADQSLADGQIAASPPCRRDLMRAARVAALDQRLIPVEAIRDERVLHAFLEARPSDFELLRLTLLKSRIPRQQLLEQHPDVLRALEQADVLTPV